MDPWDVFVSDAFDAVLTVSVVEKCGALKGFGRYQFGSRVLIRGNIQIQAFGGTGAGHTARESSPPPDAFSKASLAAFPVTW